MPLGEQPGTLPGAVLHTGPGRSGLLLLAGCAAVPPPQLSQITLAEAQWPAGKGNVKDGFSRLLTEISQGYFQPNVGGETIPVAEGELSDLVGGEPLFKALYQW